MNRDVATSFLEGELSVFRYINSLSRQPVDDIEPIVINGWHSCEKGNLGYALTRTDDGVIGERSITKSEHAEALLAFSFGENAAY
ncbi:hypothetical protein [Paenibacillus xanthanilyticus]|uniref:Uncharacterized protein n=1 Tax=Paenibacillus xanthanilyticus TaxID=1783531 RepID=A0ABV8K5N4_9BACL